MLLKLTFVLIVLSTLACNDASEKTATRAAQIDESKSAAPKADEKEWNRRRVKEFTNANKTQLGVLAKEIGVKIGAKAPDATLKNSEGQTVSLSSTWKEGSALVVFYRGGWCPYCNSQMRDLTLSAQDFAERAITPVAISVDTIDETAKTDRTYNIPFPLLSDPELLAHKAWNVTNVVDDAGHQRLLGFGIDIEKASGQKHRTIGVPSMFLVDNQGIVRWAHADPKYKIRPRAKDVLEAIDALTKK